VNDLYYYLYLDDKDLIQVAYRDGFETFFATLSFFDLDELFCYQDYNVLVGLLEPALVLDTSCTEFSEFFLQRHVCRDYFFLFMIFLVYQT